MDHAGQKEVGMAYREVYRVLVLEVIRRWQLGESRRAIARAIGLSRNTVEKYVRAAQAAGVAPGVRHPKDKDYASDCTSSRTRVRKWAGRACRSFCFHLTGASFPGSS